jgi:hypothetical protein
VDEVILSGACASMRVRVGEGREGSTRENNFAHGKLLAEIHRAAIHGVEREREREREREKLLAGIHGVAIHGIEREREREMGGKRRKSRVLFLVGV